MSALGRHKQISAGVFLAGNNRRNLFAVAQLKQVDNGAAARGFLRFGHLIALYAVNLAEIGKEQQIVVRVGYEHILHKVLFLGLVGGHSLAASFLRVIFVYRQSLDVSEVRHAHHDVLCTTERLTTRK